jgi:hypothetical protein
MRWAKSSEGKYYLVVVPLHGRGNKAGEGEAVKIFAYEFPGNVEEEWPLYPLDNSMHMTHNFDLIESPDVNKSGLYLAGKEGVRFIHEQGSAESFPGMNKGAGEIRLGKLTAGENFLTTIEPMHGQELVIYLNDKQSKRIVLDSNIKEGHALAAADLLGTGSDQIIAGWRNPNKDGKTGIKLFIKKNPSGTAWESYWIDENGIACEDLQIMDLNNDGKPDIIASGRSTRNLKIYWNKTVK